MKPTRYLLAVLTLAVLIPFSMAQERGRLRGHVVQNDGSPWPGAEVMLHSRPLAGFEWIGEEDRVTVVADERGRFRATVLPGRGYVAWAVSKVEGGIYRTTEAVSRVGAGQTLMLRERAGRRVHLRVHVDSGKRNLKEVARCIVTSEPDYSQLLIQTLRERGEPDDVALVHTFHVTVDERGVVQIPRLPWASVTLEVFDGRGIRLARQGMTLAPAPRRRRLASLGKPQEEERAFVAIVRGIVGEQPIEEMRSVTESRLQLPAPESHTVRIVAGTRRGRPVAGATVCQNIRGRLVRLATTDAGGVCKLPSLPKKPSAVDFLPYASASTRLVVRAAGFAENIAVDSRDLRRPFQLFGPSAPRGSDSEPTVVLRPGHELSGRLLDEGRPLVGVHVLLDVELPPGVGFFGLAGLRGHGLHVVETDEGGRYVIPHLPRAPFWLYAHLDGELALIASGDVRAKRQVAKDFEKSELRNVVVTAERPDGTPSMGARFAFFDQTRGRRQQLHLLQTVTDRKGTVRLRTRGRRTWLVIAHDKTGYGSAQLELRRNANVRQRIRLRPARYLAGVVVDRGGVPVAGASVRTLPMIGESALLWHVRPSRFMDVTGRRGRFKIWVPSEKRRVSLSVSSYGDSGPKAIYSLVVDVSGGSRDDYEIEFNEDEHLVPNLPLFSTPKKKGRGE